jgi:ribosomal protein S14
VAGKSGWGHEKKDLLITDKRQDYYPFAHRCRHCGANPAVLRAIHARPIY